MKTIIASTEVKTKESPELIKTIASEDSPTPDSPETIEKLIRESNDRRRIHSN